MTLWDDQVLFEEEGHLYTDQAGTSYPSVTQILEQEQAYDTRWFNEEACLRGTLVHAATAMIDVSMRPARSYDMEEWWPYVESYILWKELAGFVPEYVERRFIDTDLTVAGTLDRLGTIRDTRWTLDLKSGRKMKWHAVQLAAYHFAAQTLEDPPQKMGCVYLNPGKPAKLVEYNFQKASKIWLSLMVWRTWKERQYELV